MKKVIWEIGITAGVILIGILIYASLDWNEMRPNLLSELAGICFSTVLALAVYYRIDRYRSKSQQDSVRRLIQQSIADHLHNFLISVAIQFPLENSGRILAPIVRQRTAATREAFDAIEDLIKQLECLTTNDLEEIATSCYKQEKGNLLMISEVIGQQVSYLSSTPDFVRQFLEFDNARRELDKSINLAQSGYLFTDYKSQALAFKTLLKEIRDLYSALLEE